MESSEDSDDSIRRTQREIHGASGINEDQEDIDHLLPENQEGFETQPFDIQLPYEHSYLGKNLQAIPGLSYLDDNSIHELPILPSRVTPGLNVLIPGQTIPINLNDRDAIGAGMKRSLENNCKLFGFINKKIENEGALVFAQHGVTLDIYECGYNDNYNDNVYREFCCKARVIQRFKLLKTPRKKSGHTNWLSYGDVLILPEKLLNDPLKCFRQSSLNKYTYSSVVNRNKRDAALTPWPSMVYEKYEIKTLVKKVKHCLNNFVQIHLSNSQKLSCVSEDPTTLAFWILINFPISDDTRAKILYENNVIQRLKSLIQYFEVYERSLYCSRCSALIAKMEDMFVMSASGPQGAYVNPEGYIHETLTLNKVQNVNFDDAFSPMYSWFPGYEWTCMFCSNCNGHLGWKYISLKSNQVPKSFFGITKKSINLDNIDNNFNALVPREDDS